MGLHVYSRYQFSTLLENDEGVEFWGTRPAISVPESSEDQYHVVVQTDVRRIDLLAHKYYGNVDLWWIIAEANHLTNPLFLEIGQVLRIPALDVVEMLVFE